MGGDAFLKGLTPESLVCLGTTKLRLTHFPFRVGRESRISETAVPQSRRRGDSAPNNDLYLMEMGPLNVSREHFQIEQHEDGFYITDRGSTCGTIVEGIVIGKNREGGSIPIQNGDVIIVGSSGSKHVFKFVVE